MSKLCERYNRAIDGILQLVSENPMSCTNISTNHDATRRRQNQSHVYFCRDNTVKKGHEILQHFLHKYFNMTGRLITYTLYTLQGRFLQHKS